MRGHRRIVAPQELLVVPPGQVATAASVFDPSAREVGEPCKVVGCEGRGNGLFPRQESGGLGGVALGLEPARGGQAIDPDRGWMPLVAVVVEVARKVVTAS